MLHKINYIKLLISLARKFSKEHKVQAVWGIFPFNFFDIFSTGNTQDTESLSNCFKYFLKCYQLLAFYAADFKRSISNILGWRNNQFILQGSYIGEP